jgi:hypothetical protein
MKSSSLIFLLWIIASAARGQTPLPGGVKGAILWYTTDESTTSPGLRNQLGGNDSLLRFDRSTITSLNFHPSLVFSGSKPLQVNLGRRNLRSASYFTVYQSLDTAAENSVWNITNGGKTTLVLTTDRMADLSAYRYMNYYDVARAQPKVSIYVQHKEKDTVAISDQLWNIGVKPVAPQLPVINFKGLIPELIAFDRVLNGTERLQVASYLALKYGITLTEPGATYLNSKGEKIWEGYDYPTWHRNIAGICRDDAASLNQSIATSSNMPGLLTISANKPLPDNNFLLWGDNGKELTPAPRMAGLPLLLQKTWLIKPSGNTTPLTTELILDTKPVDAPLSLHPVYWLAIEPSGKGEFNSAAVEFVRMEKLDKDGKAFFKNIKWDKDRSGKDVLGIIAAQDLLLSAIINQPSCASPGTGSMQVKILGGETPFQLTIKNAAGVFRKIDNASSPVTITDLEAGKYSLTVTDAAQHKYVDSFYINNKDVPLATSIAASYTLQAGQALHLNAAVNMPADLVWEWKGPSSFQSFNPQVTITEPGTYTLRSSRNGCSNTQDLLIKQALANILYDVTLFPNPSAGTFTARVTLDRAAPVTMSVYNSEGKLVFTRDGDRRMNYLFTGELKASGTYEVIFTSGLSKTNKRLVIVK